MPSSMFGSHTVVTGGQFHQHNHQNIHYHHNPVSKDPFERLLEAASPTAFHNSSDVYDPPKCHPNTRVAVLDKIMNWIRGLDPETRDALIMWLYGPAGSGKSAIARSIAERCYEEGILVASYFFSRSDPMRNHGRSLIATIAYQASIRFPDIRDHIIRTVDLDPLIFTRSLDAQLLSLIIEPLQERIKIGYFDAVTAPRIVIIDGLDECEVRASQINILTTISRALQRYHLPLIFLVASRPEHDIMRTLDVLKGITTRIALNDNYFPSDDIHLFLQDKFKEIRETHPFRKHIPPAWPSNEILQSLVEKSSGQFIYASTVVKFISSSRHRPHLRLDIVLGLRPADRDMPFAELDALYRHILSSAEDHESVLRVLTLHFLPSQHHVADIEKILLLNTGDISWLLCDLTSLISVKDQSVSESRHRQELEVFQASLRDFLLDSSRAQEFYIRDPLLCAELAHLCIRYLKEGEKNRWVAWSAVELLHNATPTEELQSYLTDYSFGSLLADCGVPNLVAVFLTSIKQWKTKDELDLHRHQLQLFDQFSRGIMEKMYSDTNLIALVAVAKMTLQPSSSFLEPGSDLFQLTKAQFALDKLSFSDDVHWYSEYSRFISEFLEDPNRSGVYALNSQRYTTAAVYFLKQISNYSEQILPTYNATKGTYRGQVHVNLPWLHQKLMQQPHSSKSVKIIRADLNTVGYTDYPPQGPEHAFHLALQCLKHVLPKSGSSEELTAFARQLKFGPSSGGDDLQKRVVKGAITRYLARVDAEGAANGSSAAE